MAARVNVVGLVLATGTERGLSGSGMDALCPLGGVPLVAHAARALRDSGVIDAVAVLVPSRSGQEVRAALDRFVPDLRVEIVDGTDPDVAASAEVVVVADCHHPLAPPELVRVVLTEVSEVPGVFGGADVAVPVLPVTETVKELDHAGWIVRTLAREALGQVQAPWAMRAEVGTGRWADLRAGVDPVGLARGVPGCRLVTVAGHADAFAVRTPADLEFASAVLRTRQNESDESDESGHPAQTTPRTVQDAAGFR